MRKLWLACWLRNFLSAFSPRRDKTGDDAFSTSPWLIEEKAAAIQAGKQLLFVEEGVEHAIGGLQGDYEYIRFNRNDLADALIKAMDYVLAVTMVPLHCEVNQATNSINFKLGQPNVSLDSEIKQLTRQKQHRPNDPNIVMALAERLERNDQRSAAISEMQSLVRAFPQLAEAHHRFAHLLKTQGR